MNISIESAPAATAEGVLSMGEVGESRLGAARASLDQQLNYHPRPTIGAFVGDLARVLVEDARYTGLRVGAVLQDAVRVVRLH